MIGNQKKRRAPWSKVSKTVWRSTDTIPICICLFIPVKTKSNNRAKQMPVEWFVLKPDWYIPANIRLDEDVLKTSSRLLSSSSSEDVLKASSRRLDQDEYVRLNLTSSRRLQDVLKRCLQDVFKMSSRRLAKTSPRHLQDVLQRYLQDVFKTYHQVKLFLRRSFPKTVYLQRDMPR